MRCEDFPCCGHEPGCCPDFDEAGNQLNMKCTCGATVPLGSKSSICDACLNAADDDDGMTDVEADADTLKSAGMGTDEDYGVYEDYGWDGGQEA